MLKYSYMYTAVLIACFAVLSHQLEDCGSKLSEVKKVTITNCENLDQRCILKRNTNVTLTMEFDLKQDVKTVHAVVYGVLLDVPIPFALPNPDGCNDSGLTCPLKSGATYVYHSIMPIEKKYPRVIVDVKWILQDENKNEILCVLIPAKIN